MVRSRRPAVGGTFYDLGWAQSSTGQPRQALADYEEALDLYRDAGSRAGEAATRYNIAMIYRAGGRLDQAIDELEVVFELDRQVVYPDLASDTAMLEQVREERTQTQG